MLTEAALDVPALMIQVPRKALPEGLLIRRLRPAPPGVAAVQGDDASGDTQFLAAKAVVVLRIIASIGQHRAERQDAGGLAHDRREVGRVLARAEVVSLVVVYEAADGVQQPPW